MGNTLNRVAIIGWLGDAPTMRYTPKGTPVTQFDVATHRVWTDRETGDQRKETDWHHVVVWQGAEAVNAALTKGSRVYVAGALRTRRWQDAEQRWQSRTEVVADQVIFLDSRAPSEAAAPAMAEEDLPL